MTPRDSGHAAREPSLRLVLTGPGAGPFLPRGALWKSRLCKACWVLVRTTNPALPYHRLALSLILQTSFPHADGCRCSGWRMRNEMCVLYSGLVYARLKG